MFKTVQRNDGLRQRAARLVKDVNDVDRRHRAAVHRGACRQRSRAQQQRRRCRRRTCSGRQEGAFTGEISAGDDQGSGRRSTSSSATPSAARCSARPTSTVNRKIDGGHRGVADADRVHRRNARAARAQRDDGGARSADQGGPRRAERRSGGRARHRVRARVGHRHRPHRHARAGRRGARAHPVAAAPVVRRDRPPTGASSFMAAA